MKKFSVLLFCCLMVQLGWSQNLTIVDFTGFTGSNLSTVSPGWSEGNSVSSPSGTTSSWTRDDFANVAANGDAAKINIYTTGKDEWIISPVFTANANSMLKFDLALTLFASTSAGVLGSDDTLEVRTSVDGGVTWQALATWTASSPAISNTGQAESYSLASFAGQSMQVAFYGSEGTVNDPEDVDVFIDNIEVLNPLATDLYVTALTYLPGPACSSSLDTLTVEIKNGGNLSLDFAANNTPIGIDVTGPAIASYNTTVTSGTLAPDSTMTVTVTNMADFSVGGVFTLTAHTTYPGDLFAGNDTLTGSVSGVSTLAAPLLEDFETGVAGSPGTLPTGWTLNSQDTYQWYVEIDGTSNSTTTGPVDDHTPGGTTYIYTEATSGATGSVTEVTSPCIDLSALAAPRLGFWYHMYGSNMGTLRVDIIANGVRTAVDSIVGQQQTAETDPWLERIVSLTAYTGQTIQVVFVGTKGNGFRSDMAVDDVSFFDPLADDVGASNTSVVYGCSNAATATVSFEVTNLGIQPASGVMASFTVDGGPASTPEMIPGPIASGATVSYTFTATADVSATGAHQIIAGVAYTADLDNSNNIDTLDITNSLSYIAAPFLEDFETASSGSPGTVPAGWERTTPNTSAGWYVETDGTNNSSGTGPLDDHTPGGNIYLYTETSSGSQGDTYTLTSPCIDLSALTAPRVSFWYHMFGDDMGTMRVDALVGGVATPLDSIVGQQQTAETDPWQERIIDLAAYTGQTIQLVWTGNREGGIEGDMALDDIEVFEPFADDVTARNTSIQYGCSNAAMATVSVEVTNLGLQPATGVMASLTVDGGTPSTPEMIPGTIAPGATVIHTFTATADVSASGPHQIIAGVAYTGDLDNSNNIDTLDIVNDLVYVTAPLLEDFESATTGSPGTFPAGWTITTPNTSAGWYVESDGTTNSSGTGPLDDHTPGGSIYVYTETSSGSQGDTYTLTSPCIDLDTLLAPKLSFWYHMFGGDMGTMRIDALVGGVATPLDSIVGQQQTAETDPWLQYFIDLSAYQGQTIQLVWTGNREGSFEGDMALDDIEIFQPPTSDLAILGTDLGSSACGLDSSTMITILVENVGIDTIQMAQAQFAIDGGAYSTAETIPGPIAPGTVTSFTFTTVANLAASGAHTIDAVATATMAPDENTSNDSLSQSVINVPSITPTFPYREDFEGGAGLWTSGGTNSSWELSTPFGDIIQGAASGALAWATGDSSFYNADENSWVSTPCMDMTNAPTDSWVSMQIWWESEFSWDGANLQSSADGGVTWDLVDGFAGAENWYNDATINGNPGGFQDGWTGRNGSGSGGWVLAAHPLDASLIGNANVRFRIAFGADGGGQDDGFAFDDFTISQAPQIALGDTLVVCGTDTLDAGNPGALYSWSTGDSTQTLALENTTGVDIIDSMITVTVVDSFGIPGHDTVIVTIPASVPAATASVMTAIACNGDSSGVATVMVTGGAAPISYLWNTTPEQTTMMASALSAGTYTVMVVDSFGCMASDSVVMTEPTAITVALDSIGDASCPDAADGAISITTAGGTMPYTYAWDNGDSTEDLTSLTPGAYVGTITDANGCILVSPTLSVGSVDSATTAGFTFSFMNGETVDFTNTSSGNATSYAWDFGDGNTSTDENPSNTYATNDTVTVTLIATGPCGNDTITQTVEISTVSIDNGLARFVKVYPNPSNGIFTVAFSEMNASQVSVSVYNVHGQEVLNEVSDQTVGNFATNMDISNQPEGTYLLKIEVDGNMYMKQILKH